MRTALPMQDRDAAAQESQRGMTQFGFRDAFLGGFSQIICFRRTFLAATPEDLRTQALIDAIREPGSDRILVSSVWLFENIDRRSLQDRSHRRVRVVCLGLNRWLRGS